MSLVCAACPQAGKQTISLVRPMKDICWCMHGKALRASSGACPFASPCSAMCMAKRFVVLPVDIMHVSSHHEVASMRRVTCWRGIKSA